MILFNEAEWSLDLKDLHDWLRLPNEEGKDVLSVHRDHLKPLWSLYENETMIVHTDHYLNMVSQLMMCFQTVQWIKIYQECTTAPHNSKEAIMMRLQCHFHKQERHRFFIPFFALKSPVMILYFESLSSSARLFSSYNFSIFSSSAHDVDT